MFSFEIELIFRNLQASLNAWFEYGGAVSLPRAQFIGDVTIGEGESVPPNTEFTKTWRIRKCKINNNKKNVPKILNFANLRKYWKYAVAGRMPIAIYKWRAVSWYTRFDSCSTTQSWLPDRRYIIFFLLEITIQKSRSFVVFYR